MRSTSRCPQAARFPKHRTDARDGQGRRLRRVAQVTFMENGGIERNYESRSICATIRPIPRRVVNEVLPQATKETAMASYQLYRRDLITGHFDRITQLNCGDDIEAISLARPLEQAGDGTSQRRRLWLALRRRPPLYGRIGGPAAPEPTPAQ